MYPLLLEPIFKEYLWGGNKINEVFNFNSPYEKTAEAWTVSLRENEICQVLNGDCKNMLLKDVINKNPKNYLGEKVYNLKEFPLLIKIIDANDNLSIQVHPDNLKAIKFENYPNGKSEIWYILDAPKDSKIILGLKENITKEEFKSKLDENKILDAVSFVNVKKGDFIDIRPGCVHALTKGLLVLEVQQNSDITYRLYDFDRVDKNGNKRELHIEKSLNTIDFGKQSENILNGTKIKIGNNIITKYLKNDYFSVEKYDIFDTLTESSNKDLFYIFSNIGNEVKIIYKDGELIIPFGKSVFIPSNLGEYTFLGKSELLKSYPTV